MRRKSKRSPGAKNAGGVDERKKPRLEDEHPRPGERAIDDSEIGGEGPEYLARDLNGRLYRYLLERSSLPAFDAIATIAAHWRHREERGEKPLGPEQFWGKDPQMLVSVPWWVLCVLDAGWLRYRHRDSGITLGEAFKIEGGGQGKTPADKLHEQAMKKRLYALEIEYRCRRENLRVGLVIAIMSTDYNIPVDTLRGYRKQYGAEVRQILDLNLK